ncbi:glycoside hydrolase family 10 protein [Rudanella lutea]|uniref:glycoside hydrolase family 10 protein n=1 Tax=Rudanella lutea TaxID=451374 RepID=UPI00036A6924|nr:family 10 glycosylhydrolase [Rudanella lutea]
MPRFFRYLFLLSIVCFWAGCRPKRPVAPTRTPPAPVPKPAPKKPAPPVAVKPKPADTVAFEPLDQSVAPSPKREFRAVWIATIDNIDWPSKKGLPAEQQQAEYRALLDGQRQAGFNAVVVQVRAAADAFYAKSMEPWSEWLTGQQGLAPSPFYDPLEFMLEESHNRGMEFHAWLNLDRGTFSRRATIAPGHITTRKPEWFLSYGERKLFNLGMPVVRTYVASLVANIVRNYDVDGIHFDDYFYPYAVAGQTLRDDEAYRANYNGMSKNDWRRSNIDKLILEIRDSIYAVKPHVKFGVSPFGIWKNAASDPEGSPTSGGQAYYDLYADTRKWALEGWVDYMVPQIYFTHDHPRAPYRELVDWWTRNAGERHLYIGHGAYRVGKGGQREPSWNNPTQMPNQVRYARSMKPTLGSVYFSAKSLRDNPLGVRDSLQNNLYKYPALIPPMTWKDSLAPEPVRDLKATATPSGVELFWHEPAPAADGDRARYYVVYRFEGRQRQFRTDNPQYILTICQGESNTRFIDKTANPNKRYTYVVTAFDRLHNESRETALLVNPVVQNGK